MMSDLEEGVVEPREPLELTKELSHDEDEVI